MWSDSHLVCFDLSERGCLIVWLGMISRKHLGSRIYEENKFGTIIGSFSSNFGLPKCLWPLTSEGCCGGGWNPALKTTRWTLRRVPSRHQKWRIDGDCPLPLLSTATKTAHSSARVYWRSLCHAVFLARQAYQAGLPKSYLYVPDRERGQNMGSDVRKRSLIKQSLWEAQAGLDLLS